MAYSCFPCNLTYSSCSSVVTASFWMVINASIKAIYFGIVLSLDMPKCSFSKQDFGEFSQWLTSISCYNHCIQRAAVRIRLSDYAQGKSSGERGEVFLCRGWSVTLLKTSGPISSVINGWFEIKVLCYMQCLWNRFRFIRLSSSS